MLVAYDGFQTAYKAAGIVNLLSAFETWMASTLPPHNFISIQIRSPELSGNFYQQSNPVAK
jgi:hypothetical protein